MRVAIWVPTLGLALTVGCTGGHPGTMAASTSGPLQGSIDSSLPGASAGITPPPTAKEQFLVDVGKSLSPTEREEIANHTPFDVALEQPTGRDAIPPDFELSTPAGNTFYLSIRRGLNETFYPTSRDMKAGRRLLERLGATPEQANALLNQVIEEAMVPRDRQIQLLTDAGIPVIPTPGLLAGLRRLTNPFKGR